MAYNDWLKIDVLLQQKLKVLHVLDQECKLLIAKAEQQGEITPSLEQELNASLAKYEKLASEVANLKKTAKLLKAKIRQ